MLFGRTPAQFTVNEAGTVITATAPAGGGTVGITVVVPGDCGTVTLADAFRYSARTLAFTGGDAIGLLALAFVLLGFGALARLRLSRREG